MLAFAKDVEAGALEGSHDSLMRDLWQRAHALTSTVFSFTLGDASSQGWAKHDVPPASGSFSMTTGYSMWASLFL